MDMYSVFAQLIKTRRELLRERKAAVEMEVQLPSTLCTSNIA
jgi:hypothetical protein